MHRFTVTPLPPPEDPPGPPDPPTNRLTEILRRRHSRLAPGEAAFDRCFLPVVLYIVVLLPVNAHWPSPIGGLATGILLFGLWLRGLISLVRAWHDPSARILRFSCVFLLLMLGGLAALHLALPEWL